MELLATSYLRRKGYEARLVARQVIQALNEANGPRRVQGHELVAEIGAEI